MSPAWLVTIYCGLILLASLGGGLLPLMITITHRWMEVAVSFVAGVMLGVGLLHLLPHALSELPAERPVDELMWALLAGFLVMFLIERFMCFHHHDVPEAESSCDHVASESQTQPAANYTHDITWSGAALGLSLHSILAGLALAASVTATAQNHPATALAGFGTFLVIFLHKPLDSLTLGTLMAKGDWPVLLRHVVNALFALAIPVGAGLFYLGVGTAPAATNPMLSYALAFSAGVFLCIAMSDLLPELHFHQHDRVMLSLALLAGLSVAYLAGFAETHSHGDAGHHQHAEYLQPAEHQ
jgi:zinc and cadmium transporter